MALAILAGFLTLGIALVISHKRMSQETTRASEIEAVASLVGSFIRQDSVLKDASNAQEIAGRMNELMIILNDTYIETSGFRDTGVSTITFHRTTDSEDLYTINYTLVDEMSEREEVYHVVVSLR